MIDESQLQVLMREMESFRVERTTSVNDTAKFSEAICAFSNDMSGSGMAGYLLIGVDDKTGQPTGLTVNDQLLRTLAGIGTEGNILPAPAMVCYKLSLAAGDVAVVEVQPSPIPPVRFKGLVCIRRGPRKGIANESEERILSERRGSRNLTFDSQPCEGSRLDDLEISLFATGYRPLAVSAEIIDENERTIDLQLASLRFFDLSRVCPTHAGMLLFGKNPLFFEPHAFVQFVWYEGEDESSEVSQERRFSGDLLSLLRDLDQFAKSIVLQRPVDSTALSEESIIEYPVVAIRELLMNAVMHRAYDQPSPIRVLRFANRLEILSPGPLHGLATPVNFPRQTSYRNPVVAEAMKTLGFVNRFGRGVERARKALESNRNPPAEFEFGDTFFGVTLEARK